MTIRIWLVLLLSALPLLSMDLPKGSRLVLSGFKTRSYREDGEMEWELQGDEALVRGTLIELRELHLIFYPVDSPEVVIKSPYCEFNQGAGEGRSEDQIMAESQGMKLHGRGYDIFFEKQLLHIRGNVCMTLKRIPAFPAEKNTESKPGAAKPECIEREMR